MLEEMLTDEVKELFLEDLLKDNFTYSNHKFSLRYKHRKKRILKTVTSNRNKNMETTGYQSEHTRIPMKYVLLIVILLVFAILGFTVYRNYSGLFVKEQDEFSFMFADYNQNAPVELTEKFFIDMELCNYEQEIIEDNGTCRWIEYKLNGEKQFDVKQATIAEVESRLNTENAIVLPTNVNINGWEGMYFQAQDGWYLYYFNLGDYIISYAGLFNKIEIEKLVKSTNFA